MKIKISLVFVSAFLLFYFSPLVQVNAGGNSILNNIGTSPSSGSTVRLGDRIKVTWDNTKFPVDDTLSISFVGPTASIGGNIYVKNTGSTYFTIPITVPSRERNGLFGISIIDISKPTAGGNLGSNDLKIIDCNNLCTGPRLKIISPNSNNRFKPLGKISLKWTSANIPKDSDLYVSISPTQGDMNVTGNTSPVISYLLKTKNTGSATINLPNANAFGPLLKTQSKSFSKKYELWLSYYPKESDHMTMGNSHPDITKYNSFSLPGTANISNTETIAVKSDTFTISSK